MRILLDTNVWRYLVDSKDCSELLCRTKCAGLQLAVCPSTVIETLMIGDTKLRNSIIELQTRPCWYRLLPDAYLESQDFKRELLKHHPYFGLKEPNFVEFKRLLRNWEKKNNGWWQKARLETQNTADFYRNLNHENLSEARSQAEELRSEVFASRIPMIKGSISYLKGSFQIADGTRLEREAWRVYGEHVWANLLKIETPARQWLNCDLDLYDLMHGQIELYRKFWFDDADASAMPRAWLRCAFYSLQADRRVTAGTPVDQTIATHLVDVDLFVSADKAMIEMVNRCRAEAPFQMAEGFHIGAGEVGVRQLYDYFTKFHEISASNQCK